MKKYFILAALIFTAGIYADTLYERLNGKELVELDESTDQGAYPYWVFGIPSDATEDIAPAEPQPTVGWVEE